MKRQIIKKADLQRLYDGARRQMDLNQEALRCQISGTCDDSVGFTMDGSYRRISMALWNCKRAHGGFIVTIERCSDYQQPFVEVQYLDDAIAMVASGYGTSENHRPVRDAILRFQAKREELFSVKVSA